jgi:hypothetical protein
MKGERRLRLVPPPSPPTEGDEPPFTDEELAAAAATRDAFARGDQPLAADLRAAFAPAPLAEPDLEAILGRALGEEEDEATRAEREAAARLRDELAGRATPDASLLLRELALAARPTALAPERNEALIEAALRKAARRTAARRIAPVTMAALSTVAAIAAGVALFFGRADLAGQRPAATSALIRARSADGLFDAATPFPRSGDASKRIDRIAAARASDLRKNRFATWGVR